MGDVTGGFCTNQPAGEVKDIPYSSNSHLEIPLEFYGEGEQIWEVRFEGPIERIATTEQNQNL